MKMHLSVASQWPVTPSFCSVSHPLSLPASIAVSTPDVTKHQKASPRAPTTIKTIPSRTAMGKASKRQQRARDQLRDLGFSNPPHKTPDQDDGESDQDDSDTRPSFSKAINTFASLDEGEGQLDEDSPEEDSPLPEIAPLPKVERFSLRTCL